MNPSKTRRLDFRSRGERDAGQISESSNRSRAGTHEVQRLATFDTDQSIEGRGHGGASVERGCHEARTCGRRFV
jgi:hypothetical protein